MKKRIVLLLLAALMLCALAACGIHALPHAYAGGHALPNAQRRAARRGRGRPRHHLLQL